MKQYTLDPEVEKRFDEEFEIEDDGDMINNLDVKRFIAQELEKVVDEERPKYVCPSYFDDGEVKNCTCGTCKKAIISG